MNRSLCLIGDGDEIGDENGDEVTDEQPDIDRINRRSKLGSIMVESTSSIVDHVNQNVQQRSFSQKKTKRQRP